MSCAFYLSDHLVPLLEQPPHLLPGGFLSERRRQDEGLMSEASRPSITPRHQEGTSCLHSFAFSLSPSPRQKNSHKFPEVIQDTVRQDASVCMCVSAAGAGQVVDLNCHNECVLLSLCSTVWNVKALLLQLLRCKELIYYTLITLNAQLPLKIRVDVSRQRWREGRIE